MKHLLKIKKYFKPLIFVLTSIALGSIGALFTAPTIPTWYVTLAKSPLNPPSWVFGPVWTILFALMGFSAYLIYKQGFKQEKVREALFIFGVQFLYNVAWSILFFGLRSPLLGLIDIIFLWVFILLTILRFRPINKTAAYLLVPYLAWVTFASFLNLSVYWLNR